MKKNLLSGIGFVLFFLSLTFNGFAISYNENIGTLTPGNTVTRTGSTVGMSNMYGNGSPDYVYMVYISGACSLEVNTCGCGWDSYLHVLDASDTRLAYDDDACGSASSRISGLSIPSAGYYYIVVDGYSSSNSGAYTLTLVASSGTTTLSGGSISIGTTTVSPGSNPGTFSSVAASGGTGSYSYQWQQSSDNSNWLDINGQTSPTLTVLSLNYTSSFRRKVTSGLLEAYSNEVKITVPLNGGIITIGSNTYPYSINSTNLAKGGLPTNNPGYYFYTWEKSTDKVLWQDLNYAAGNANFVQLESFFTNSTWYRRRAINNVGEYAYSNAVCFELPVTGGAIELPGNKSVFACGTTPGTLLETVAATNGNGIYSYQWQQSTDNDNWADIANANSSTFTVPVITTNIYYRRKVTSGSSEAYSNTINVTALLDGGTISCSFTSVTYNESPGTISSLVPALGGTGNITYQWQKGDVTSWTDIPGETNSSYTAPKLTNSVLYRRVAINGTQIAFSNVILIDVPFSAGKIGLGPDKIYFGNPVRILNVESPKGGSGVNSCAWQKSLDGVNWFGCSVYGSEPNITDLTSSAYFRRVDYNSNSSGYTNTVWVKVYLQPLIPGYLTVATNTVSYGTSPGKIENIQEKRALPPNLSYVCQWQQSTDNVNWIDISGATDMFYNAPALNVTTYYRWKLTTLAATNYAVIDDNPPTYSNVVGIKVALDGGAISCSSTTADYGINPGIVKNDTSARGGSGIYQYQWQQSRDAVNWTNINGQTGLTYNIPPLTETTLLRRMVTSDNQTAYSNVVQFVLPFLGGAISIDKTIIPYNISPGTINSATPATGGLGYLSYYWQRSFDNVNWKDINAFTAVGLTWNVYPLTYSTYFRRVASLTGSSIMAYSNVVFVKVQLAGGTIGIATTSVSYGSSPGTTTNVESATGGLINKVYYQWQKTTDNVNWTNISSSGLVTLDVPNLFNTTWIRRVASNDGDVAYSNIICIRTPLVDNSIGFYETSVNYGTAPSRSSCLDTPTGGTGTYTYQWQQSTDGLNWNNIAGETNPTIQAPPLYNSIYYRRAITSETTLYSKAFIIRVKPESGTIGISKTTIEKCTSPGVITATNLPKGGNGIYTYRWFQSTNNSSWHEIPDATSSDYIVPELNSTTWFKRYVTSHDLVAESNTVCITVLPSTLTGGTVSAVTTRVEYGNSPGTITSTALPTGGEGVYTYQWEQSVPEGWETLIMATEPAYTVNNLTQSTSFRRKVSSGCSTAYSNIIDIVVYEKPFKAGIIDLSTDLVAIGKSPGVINSFNPASGGPNGTTYSYQWQQSADNQTWANITGQTGLDYCVPALYASTFFRRIASYVGLGSPSSSNVLFVPVILSPGSISISKNTVALSESPGTFVGELASGGFGYYQYSWQTSEDGINWVQYCISGTDPNLTAPVLQKNTWFRREVYSSSYQKAYSNEILISVFKGDLSAGLISIRDHFDEVSVQYGESPGWGGISPNSSPATGGTGIYTYQWQESVDNQIWTAIPGANNQAYNLPVMASSKYLRRMVTSGYKTAYSNIVHVVVIVPDFLAGSITVGSPSVSYGTSPGVISSISTATGGTGNFTYRWQQSSDNVTWTNIPDQTALSYTVPSLTATTTFRRVVTCAGNDMPSNAITITVTIPPLIAGTIGTDKTTVDYPNTPWNFTSTIVASGGIGSYAYQWQQSTDNLNWIDITGQTATTYTVPKLDNSTSFRRKVTSGNAIAYTAPISITVIMAGINAGTISIQKTSVFYNSTPGSFTASAASGGKGNFSYLWQQSANSVNWTDISGATLMSYTVPNLTVSTSFRRAAISDGVTAYSNSVLVTVTVPPLTVGTILNNAIEVTACTTSITIGDPDLVVTGGEGNYSYQWQQSTDLTNWADITGKTSKSFMLTLVTATTTWYRLAISSGETTAYSNLVAATYKPLAYNPTIGGTVTAGTPGSSYNYIRTQTLRDPVTSEASITGSARVETIAYFDGLGRPVQTITVQGTPAKADMIEGIEYDAFGRDFCHYLPFAKAGNNGAYLANAQTAVQSYYNVSTPTAGHESTSSPWNKTLYEASPLNRVTGTSGPGVWEAKPTSVSYQTNTAAIAHWDAAKNAISFAANSLYVTETTDEDGNRTREFKDKLGQVVRKESYDGTAWLRTAYVYDDFGQLVIVVPPKAASASDAELCYYYAYDQRHRMTMKDLPGAEPVYMVYDNRDRLALSQDGVQRPANKWSFTRYDQFNRPVLTGEVVINTGTTGEASRKIIADNFASFSGTLYETTGTTLYGYTSQSFPAAYNSSITTDNVLTATYYDNYDFLSGTDYAYQSNMAGEPASRSVKTKGLVTGSRTKVLAGGETMAKPMALTVNYYDDYGRLVQTVADNHFEDTSKEVTHTACNFAGQPVKTVTEHRKGNASYQQTLVTSLAYDHQGRLLTTKMKINSDNEFTLASLKYNELGEVIARYLHGDASGNNFNQQVDYTYNPKGWLRTLNTPGNLGNDLMALDLRYNSPQTGTSLGGATLFNGNISQMMWATSSAQGQAGTPAGYGFTYDGLNRLRSAAYADGIGYTANAGRYSTTYSYDANGNMSTLTRNLDGAQVDNLTYTYLKGIYNNPDGGNRLGSVTDNIPNVTLNPRGYKAASGNYEYDNNGNMTKDISKGFIITYNSLNLPQLVSSSVTDYARYTYDAAGTKLAKTVVTNGTAENILNYRYSGIFLYEGKENLTLTSIFTPEGRIVPQNNGTAMSYSYEYNLKDHLGNTRVTFTGHANGRPEVNQLTSYDPYGLVTSQTSYYPTGASKNKLLYNGKEIQDDVLAGTKIDWFDYGARMYDPEIGRWHSVDPMAEKYYAWSPYSYGLDKPISNIDVGGHFVFKDASKYPELNRILQNIGSVLDNSNIMNNLQKFSGMSSEIIRQQFSYGNGPEIKVGDLQLYYQRLGETSKNGNITLDEATVRHLDNALKSWNMTEYNDYLFLVVLTILHEYNHSGDLQKDGMASDENQLFINCLGYQFEQATFGMKTITKFDAQRFLGKIPFVNTKENNDKNAKQERDKFLDKVKTLSPGHYKVVDGEIVSN